MLGFLAIRRAALALGLPLLALALLFASVSALRAQEPPPTRRFVPIGASYRSATIDLFAAQAIAHDSDSVVQLRILPIAYHTNSVTITLEVRQENLALAQVRANQIQAACENMVVSPTTCVASVPDIQIRSDAYAPANVAMLGSDVDGVYILGGDQLVAMEVIANTPTEAALETLYTSGAVIGGNSAGAAVQSRYMIAGYSGDNYAWHGLQRGAVELWYGPDAAVTRGLRFGVDEAVIDQHVLERGRIARLLQATEQSPGQKVGLGVDWGTGVLIENERHVTSTAGYYATVILDEESYGAAAGATYRGSNQTLSIHDVALHLLPEGPYGYDLQTRRPVVSGTESIAPDISGRDFRFLRAPAGGAPLYLTGDLATAPTGTVASRFALHAARSVSPTVVLAAGYVSESVASQVATRWAGHLRSLGVTTVQTATLTPSTNPAPLLAQLSAAGAVFITADDQAALSSYVAQLNAVGANALLRQRWQQGTVMLFDNAAAAAVGSWMSAEPTPTDDDREFQSSDSFLYSYLTIRPGLAMIPGAIFEPRVLSDYRYGRLVSQVAHHPEAVAFGIERGTAIEVTAMGAQVIGPGAVIAIDGRQAGVLEAGQNDAIAATWLLLDTFTEGEELSGLARLFLPIVTRAAP